jgi:hypothetical protein
MQAVKVINVMVLLPVKPHVQVMARGYLHLHLQHLQQ